MPRFFYRTILLAALALGACGRTPFDAAAMFEQQFGSSVIIRGSAATNDRDPAACAVAQLVEAGRIRFVPATGGEPYFTLATSENSATGGDLVLFSGRRRLATSSEEQRYTRDASDYFAQTVTYFINDENALLRPTNPQGFGPFSMRLVYVNDPAVGQWRLASYTPISGGETPGSEQGAMQAILNDVAQRGCPVAAMTAAATAARAEALNRIERQMAESGVLARGPGNALVSRVNRRIWHVASTDMRGRRWRDMFTICNGINIAAGRNWRPASLEDLRTLVTPSRNNNGGGVLVDTPDRRFFGNVPGTFVTSTLLTYEGNPTTLSQAETRRAMYQVWHFQRHSGQTEYRPDMNLTWEPGNYPLEYVSLICVGDYSG